jgi:cytochrome c
MAGRYDEIFRLFYCSMSHCIFRRATKQAAASRIPKNEVMVAYFNWMKGATKPEDRVPGRGVGKIDMAIVPDVDDGKKVYAEQCAVYHGKDGEGQRQRRAAAKNFAALSPQIVGIAVFCGAAPSL